MLVILKKECILLANSFSLMENNFSTIFILFNASHTYIYIGTHIYIFTYINTKLNISTYPRYQFLFFRYTYTHRHEWFTCSITFRFLIPKKKNYYSNLILQRCQPTTILHLLFFVSVEPKWFFLVLLILYLFTGCIKSKVRNIVFH